MSDVKAQACVRPALVAHCDWSMRPGKRWMATALRAGDRWQILPPEPVGPSDSLFERLCDRARGGGILVGFDFPIGLPAHYGKQTGLPDFQAALRAFGSGSWHRWFDVCDAAGDISIYRPFYPMRPGGRSKAQLLRGHHADSPEKLLRECERKTEHRGAACSLFWTLGGNQVGKGAISGWREVLRPDLNRIAIWPFDGRLRDLLDTRHIVVAETYPGDVYARLGITRTPVWSKRSQAGRASVSAALRRWLDTRSHCADPHLLSQIDAGFSEAACGEDEFDAVIGLFGMLDVVAGYQPEGGSRRAEVARWEGWILGQRMAARRDGDP